MSPSALVVLSFLLKPRFVLSFLEYQGIIFQITLWWHYAKNFAWAKEAVYTLILLINRAIKIQCKMTL